MSGYEGRQKFQIATPLETHWGKALCDKETCKKFTEGWRITVDRELVMPNGTKSVSYTHLTLPTIYSV